MSEGNPTKAITGRVKTWIATLRCGFVVADGDYETQYPVDIKEVPARQGRRFLVPRERVVFDQRINRNHIDAVNLSFPPADE